MKCIRYTLCEAFYVKSLYRKYSANCASRNRSFFNKIITRTLTFFDCSCFFQFDSISAIYCVTTTTRVLCLSASEMSYDEPRAGAVTSIFTFTLM